VVAGRGHQHIRCLVWRRPFRQQCGRVVQGVSAEETKPQSDSEQSDGALKIGEAVG